MFVASHLARAMRGVLALTALIIGALALLTATPAASAAASAVTADPFAPAMFILNAGRTSGYQFTVTDVLQVTHLGLYDWQADGFQISYPIGIWKEGGELISYAEMPSGTAGTLIDGFRYVQAGGPPSASGGGDPIILSPGQTYTIGYFASTIAGNDRMISFDGWHQFDELVSQVGIAVATGGAHPDLTMPTFPHSAGFEYWFGPSFRFDVVPGPAGAMVMVIGSVMMRSRQRKG